MSEADNGEKNAKPTEERYPITEDHLFVITELAKLGLSYLKLVLPQFEKEQDGAGKNKRQFYAHLKSLYEVAGPETVKHFDEMCQYLYDQSKGVTEGKDSNGGIVEKDRRA